MEKGNYTVRGFKAGAVSAGLKKDGGLDLALIYSEKEAVAAGVFTTNQVKAAPVILTHENIKKGKARAIIANAGNANACTGEEGLTNARVTADLVAGELEIEPQKVLVASTGVIGAQLNMDFLKEAIPGLAKSISADKIPQVAEAIMTTDTFRKISQFEGMADGNPYYIVGVAKGAGMIMPQMATMLCFIMSDVKIDTSKLQEAVSLAARRTFNRVTVDGDTSTNDMVLAMANGMAGNGELSSGDYKNFLNGMASVMDELATMMVRDGEGATKVVRVKIKGAAYPEDAETAARTVANSSLVKTAFYGEDPNWGRVMAALGRSGIRMNEQNIGIWINDIQIVKNGLGAGVDAEKKAGEKMKEKSFELIIDLNQGDYEDQVTTCDMTHDYISINADYRT